MGAIRRVGHDRFLVGLGIITAAGLVLRLVYVLGFRHDFTPGGDAHFYHYGTNLLVHGKGFVQPLVYIALDRRVEAADHPPLYFAFLAIPSLVGLGTAKVHLVWSALLGTATIFTTGLLGRRVAAGRAELIAGSRTGWIAAALVAVYPNVWVYDGQLLSETLAIFVATLALLLAYRAYEQPTTARLCALGGACGAAALSRSELALLVPALLWPIAAISHAGLRRAAGATLVALAVVTPWVAYNLSRFEHPVLLSSQLEPTLAGANCSDTYSGPALGGLTSTCLRGLDPLADQSVNAKILRTRVRHFVDDNLSRVPVVVAARVGRVTGLYRPSAQIDLDVVLEGRDRPVAIAGLLSGYVVGLAAIAGIVVLRRRRDTPVFPLLVLPAIALLTVAATYGTDRFRASAETSLAVLAAVAIDAAWRRSAADLSSPPGD